MRGEGEDGAAAVEFAIVASLLFVILFGTIQFGIAYNRYQGLHAAAREGARLGSIPTTTVAQIEDRVRSTVSIVSGSSLADGCPATLGVDQGCIDIVPPGGATFQPCNLRTGQTVAVTVRYRMKLDIPLWGSPAVTVAGTGEFGCE